MYLVYSLLLSLGIIVTAPYYLWRLRGNIISGAGWRERLGLLPTTFQQDHRGAIWIHAVSVGETLTVVGLVRQLQQRYPGRKIFLSHLTPAGRGAGEHRVPEAAGRFYLPLDWSWAVRRAIRRIRPSLLLIVETELWPNLLRATRESGAGVVLVNARVSKRSFPRYRLIRPFIRRVLENVDRICAQSAPDAERFRCLGAKPERVVLTGNLKFDATPPQSGELVERLGSALQLAQRGPVIVAASTMPGEETLLLPVWDAIRRRNRQALMILAPRHPARFEAVSQQLSRERRSFVRRSTLAMEPEKLAGDFAGSEILLLDSIGELAGIFVLADVVFMGGSLVPTGGHNLLEPAYWGKPILFGPYMENFRDMVDLFVRAGAAVQVCDSAELIGAANELIDNPERRRKLGEAAKKVLKEQTGATGRTLREVQEWLADEVAGTPAAPRSVAP